MDQFLLMIIVQFAIIMAPALVIMGFVLWRYRKEDEAKRQMSKLPSAEEPTYVEWPRRVGEDERKVA